VPSFITRQEASEQAGDSEADDDDEEEDEQQGKGSKKSVNGGRAVTHVVVVNLDAPEGRDLLGQVGQEVHACRLPADALYLRCNQPNLGAGCCL
jgi:hypothetical protein